MNNNINEENGANYLYTKEAKHRGDSFIYLDTSPSEREGAGRANYIRGLVSIGLGNAQEVTLCVGALSHASG